MSLPKDFDLSSLNQPNSQDLKLLNARVEYPSPISSVLALPGYVETITQAQEPDAISIAIQDSLSVIPAFSLLTPGSQPVREVSSRLTAILKQPDTSDATPYSKPYASLLSDCITHQIGLPPRRKLATTTLLPDMPLNEALYRIRDIKSRLELSFDPAGDPSAFNDLKHVNFEYQKKVFDFADKLGIETLAPDELSQALTKLDRSIGSSALYREIHYFLSPDYTDWETGLVSIASTKAVVNPELLTLLNGNRLENLSSYLRIRLWGFLELAAGTPADIQSNPVLQAAGEYFLTHPDVSTYFWQYATAPGNKILTPQTKGSEPTSRSARSLYSNSRITEWALLQDETTFQSFLATLNLDDISASEETRIISLNQLWFITGSLRSKYPDNKNLDTFIDRLAGESDVLAPDTFSQVSSVLKDKTAGVIYQTLNHQTKTSSGSESQSEVLKNLKSKSARIAFISESGWPETEKEEKSDKETKKDAEPPRLIIPSTEYTLPGIGKLHETHPGYAVAVLGALEETVHYPMAHSRDLDKLSSKLRHTLPTTHALFPGLLPNSHPLNSLETAGIVAVIQAGTFVEVIVNSEKAWFKPEGNLALQGEIRDRKLVMEGARDPSSHPKIHHLVEAGLGYLAQPDLSKELSKDEISEVRRLIKDWKNHAKTYGLPQDLSRVDNPMYRDPNLAYTVVQVGTKNDLLKIV